MTLQIGPATATSVMGPEWLAQTADQWRRACSKEADHVSVDLSGIEFVSLFDWVQLCSWVKRILARTDARQIDLDVLGHTPLRLVPPEHFVNADPHPDWASAYRPAELAYSRSRYRVLGFVEGLGTLDALNDSTGRRRVLYPGVDQRTALFRSWYSQKPGEHPTVILGLHPVVTKADCIAFLDSSHILTWRERMGGRFRSSPLFASDEVWRVVSHELAANILEHSGEPGILAARIVETSKAPTGDLQPWCKLSYSPQLHALLKTIKGGFLELCASDAGVGLAGKLRPAWEERAERTLKTAPSAEETKRILAFAFDELGTSKSRDAGWAILRHGLYRLLLLVEKYGGALAVRSGGVEIGYVWRGVPFDRYPHHTGFIPTWSRVFPEDLGGTQVQLLLPLIPQVTSTARAPAKPTLERWLPLGYFVEDEHPRGHLVPLLETLEGGEASMLPFEISYFREQCEALARQLILSRPDTEAVIFDFSGLQWTLPQFETFLFLMQNVLQRKPCLLVEVDPALVLEAQEYERAVRPTHLDASRLFPSSTGYMEVSEKAAFETHREVHIPLLIVDSRSQLHVLGICDGFHEAALLDLVDNGRTIEEIRDQFQDCGEAMLRALLTPAHKNFELVKGRWHCAWSGKALNVAGTRSLARHFDLALERTAAWRKQEGALYYLPWAGEWRSEFLQLTLFLSRGRQADEVAQRMLYRLSVGLRLRTRQLTDVRVLAATSTSGLLIAAALHRWWPLESKPAVVDIGHHVFNSDSQSMPTIAMEGGIVLVEEIVSSGGFARRIVDMLVHGSAPATPNRSVLAVLALVAFQEPEERHREEHCEAETAFDLSKSQFHPTAVGFGWLDSEIPTHAMFVGRHPRQVFPSEEPDPDRSYRIDPRSRRPIRFATLRRDFGKERDKNLERRNGLFTRFDQGEEACLVSAGHLVYGSRHSLVAVDVRRALAGTIGDDLSQWIAQLCIGSKNRIRAPWESDKGAKLTGDVFAVLMPAHSQIHYLWPKIQMALARAGRRQPMWQLEASVFSESEATYRLPIQLRTQIRKAHGERRRLRLLVLDDAMASGRTILGVLAALIRELRTYPNAVDWIRYFTLLDQRDFAAHSVWNEIHSFPDQGFRLEIESFVPLVGVKVYSERDCPVCRERRRIERLIAHCGPSESPYAAEWLAEEASRLVPVALEAPRPQSAGQSFARALDVLGKVKKPPSATRLEVRNADTAIWRFYDLIEVGCPPSDLLLSSAQAWSDPEESDDDEPELSRYRWTLLQWSLWHWRRIESDSATGIFVACAQREVEANSRLVPGLLSACSTRARESAVWELLRFCIERLAALEVSRDRGDEQEDPRGPERLLNLDLGLTLFSFGLEGADGEVVKSQLVQHLHETQERMGLSDHTFVGLLRRRLKGDLPGTRLRWALETVAESLLRGRDLAGHEIGPHRLLPWLVNEVAGGHRDLDTKRRLAGALHLFVAALSEVTHYYAPESPPAGLTVVDLANAVLSWTTTEMTPETRSDDVPALRDLAAQLESGGVTWRSFLDEFRDTFHRTLGDLEEWLSESVTTNKLEDKVHLVFTYSDFDRSTPFLAPFERVANAISNRAIEPGRAITQGSRVRSLIQVSRDGPEIRLRLLTSFQSFDVAKFRVETSPKTSGEARLLAPFGVRFGQPMPAIPATLPSTTVLDVWLPLGFLLTEGGST